MTDRHNEGAACGVPGAVGGGEEVNVTTVTAVMSYDLATAGSSGVGVNESPALLGLHEY